MLMNKDVERILVSEEELDAITTRLAKEIDRDYSRPDRRLLLVCILKGSIVFMGDLMKKLTVPVEIDCMKVSSYGAGTVSTGSIHIYLDLIRPILIPAISLLSRISSTRARLFPILPNTFRLRALTQCVPALFLTSPQDVR